MTTTRRPRASKRAPTDYTEGSITRSIIGMGAPSVLGFMVSHVYVIVDTWWVAQLPQSHTAVAGITFFTTILWFFGAINSMVGSGSVPIIARRYGEKDFAGAEVAIAETLLLKFFAALIFTAVAAFSLKDLMYLAGARGEALRLGYEFGLIIMWGLPFAFMSYTVWTSLRSVANPQMAMIIMLSSTILNAILGPTLMFGWFGLPAMGIRGTAISTVACYFLTVVTGLVIFFGGYANVRLHWGAVYKARWETMWLMCKIGMPSWIAQAASHGARLAVIPLLAGYGDTVVAAYGLCTQAVNVAGAFIGGIGLGLGVLMGHNLGAGKRERARQTGDRAIKLGVGVMCVLGSLAYLGAPILARAFFHDPVAIDHTVEALRVFAFSFPFIGLWGMIDSVHSGVGRNVPGMVIMVIYGWVGVYPSVYFLTQVAHTGSMAIWGAMSASLALLSLAYYFYYRRGAWLEEAS